MFPVINNTKSDGSPLRLTPEDLLSFKSVSDAQISPDGTKVAFVIGESFKMDSSQPKSQIWVVSNDGTDLRVLTAGTRTDSLPRWSPDGKALAFASDRIEDGQKQIYLLSFDGGEARGLTEIKGAIPTPRGLNSLQWSPDGEALAFLKEDVETLEEKFKNGQKDDAIEFEKNHKYVRLWVVEVATRKVRCASPEGAQVWEFAWSPDSTSFAATVSDFPYEWSWYHNRLVRFQSSEETPYTLYQNHRSQVALPRWSPDGLQIAFLSSFWSDRGVTSGDIWAIAARGGEARNLTQDMEASFGWMEWQPNSQTLTTLAHEKGGMSLSEVHAQRGQRKILWLEEVTFAEPFWPRFSLACPRDNDQSKTGEIDYAPTSIAVVREDASHPRDIWIAVKDALNDVKWRQLTHLHPQTEKFQIGTMESIRWKGADGWEMQGILVQPVGYERGKKYPLVTWVHGGPASSATFRYATDGYTQLLAARGIAVFLPNYRGSVGRGVEFVESNFGDLGGKDFQDILLGVEQCVQLGIADSSRLGIGGWSYGGFMAAWAVTQTDRFKAAVMGAGISNWLSFHGNSVLADWDAMHLNANPYDRDGVYQRFSPINHVRRVRTPTLILHGEKDGDVPPEQSYQFFRALKDLNIETDLVIYPREGHAPCEKMHLLDLARRIPDWFEKHLK